MADAAKQMMILEGGDNDGPILPISGTNFVVSNAVSRLSLSSSTPEIVALKIAFEL